MISINRWLNQAPSRVFVAISRLSRWFAVSRKNRQAARRRLVYLLTLLMIAAFISGLPAAIEVWGQTGGSSATVTVTAVPGIIGANPVVTSYLPANGATDVIPDDNLVLTFDKTVVKGSGNIVIYKPDNTPFETIAVTDAKVTISGSEVTINPNGVLASETIYYVQIATTAIDAAGISYDGITDTTTWQFTTIAYSDRVDDSLTGVQTEYTVTNIPADTTVTATTTDSLIITILKYEGNPRPAAVLPTDVLTDSFIDVSINKPDKVVWPLYVEQAYTDAEIAGVMESSLRMYYFRSADSTWLQCSDTGVDTAGNFVWAKITEAEFFGSQLLIRGSVIDSGNGTSTISIRLVNVNILGTEGQFRISSAGKTLEEISVTSPGGKITMLLSKGIVVLDKDGNPPLSLTVVSEENSPPPPEGMAIIGKSYEFSPTGITYTPDAYILWAYDEADIPEGVAEESLFVAFYHYHENPEENEWHAHASSIDIENNVVTADCPSHSIHALLGTITPPTMPAAFTVSALSIQPAEVQPGEPVTITASVANSGGTKGSYALVLKINGLEEAREIITLAAGNSLEVSFTVAMEDTGSYSITVGELNDSFSVVAPVSAEEEEEVPVSTPPSSEEEGEVPVSTPFNRLLVGGIIAAVIIGIALLIFFLFRKRWRAAR